MRFIHLVNQDAVRAFALNRYCCTFLRVAAMVNAIDLNQELRNAFGNVYLTIEVDLLNHWVHTNWVGHLTEEITKAGTETYTKTVKDSGFNCVLNDSRQVVGRWEHSVEWALHEWVPMAVY